MHLSTFLLAPLLALPCLLAAGESISLRGDSYAPFNGDPNAEKPGVMIEIAKEIFGRRGVAIDYQIMPWTRAMEECKAGRIDGLPGAEPSMRADYAFPEENQGSWRPVFVTPAASNWTYTGQASLSSLVVGIVQDYDYGKDPQGNSYGEWFKANPKNVHVLKGERALELAVGMLSKNRIGATIEDWGVILASCASAKTDPATLRNAGVAGPGYPMYIAFSPTPRGQALAKELSDGTVEMRRDGRLAKVLAKYGMSDWK